ncbi:MAG TPA: hypothetical protein VKY19_20135 [Ktedonosporobacter sp.]|nr:hypothetical protein [Ktedonosporobacter sp.]
MSSQIPGGTQLTTSAQLIALPSPQPCGTVQGNRKGLPLQANTGERL